MEIYINIITVILLVIFILYYTIHFKPLFLFDETGYIRDNYTFIIYLFIIILWAVSLLCFYKNNTNILNSNGEHLNI